MHFEHYHTKLRKDELEKIAKNLEKIKNKAALTTTKDFGKFIGL